MDLQPVSSSAARVYQEGGSLTMQYYQSILYWEEVWRQPFRLSEEGVSDEEGGERKGRKYEGMGKGLTFHDSCSPSVERNLHMLNSLIPTWRGV